MLNSIRSSRGIRSTVSPGQRGWITTISPRGTAYLQAIPSTPVKNSGLCRRALLTAGDRPRPVARVGPGASTGFAREILYIVSLAGTASACRNCANGTVSGAARGFIPGRSYAWAKVGKPGVARPPVNRRPVATRPWRAQPGIPRRRNVARSTGVGRSGVNCCLGMTRKPDGKGSISAARKGSRFGPPPAGPSSTRGVDFAATVGLLS